MKLELIVMEYSELELKQQKIKKIYFQILDLIKDFHKDGKLSENEKKALVLLSESRENLYLQYFDITFEILFHKFQNTFLFSCYDKRWILQWLQSNLNDLKAREEILTTLEWTLVDYGHIMKIIDKTPWKETRYIEFNLTFDTDNGMMNIQRVK